MAACPIDENKFLIHSHEKSQPTDKLLSFEAQLGLEEISSSLPATAKKHDNDAADPSRYEFISQKLSGILEKILPAGDFVENVTKLHPSDGNLRSSLTEKRLNHKANRLGFDSSETLSAFLHYAQEDEAGGKSLNLSVSYLLSLLGGIESLTTEGFSADFESKFKEYMEAPPSPSPPAMTSLSPGLRMKEERLKAIRTNVLMNMKYVVKFPALTESLNVYSKGTCLVKKFDKKEIALLKKMFSNESMNDLACQPPPPSSTVFFIAKFSRRRTARYLF